MSRARFFLRLPSTLITQVGLRHDTCTRQHINRVSYDGKADSLFAHYLVVPVHVFNLCIWVSSASAESIYATLTYTISEQLGRGIFSLLLRRNGRYLQDKSDLPKSPKDPKYPRPALESGWRQHLLLILLISFLRRP